MKKCYAFHKIVRNYNNTEDISIINKHDKHDTELVHLRAVPTVGYTALLVCINLIRLYLVSGSSLRCTDCSLQEDDEDILFLVGLRIFFKTNN